MTPNYLKTQNKHPKDDTIRLEESSHTYYINNKSGYTSVTTFNHSLFENFNASKVIDKMMASKYWHKNKYYGQTKEEIINSWKKNGCQAAVAGTRMHYDIECFYNHIEVENSSKEFKFFLNFHDNHRNLNPFRTEWLIYDPKLLFAGAIDFVSKNEDGTLSIYDWKRCKKIQQKNQYNKFSTNPIISHIPDTNFWHYSLQLNIYKWILEHNYNETVSEMFLVCLHPDQKNYEKIKVPNLHTDIENLIEFRREQLKNKSDL